MLIHVCLSMHCFFFIHTSWMSARSGAKAKAAATSSGADGLMATRDRENSSTQEAPRAPNLYLLSSCWFQSIWKILGKLDHFPKVRGENKKSLNLPTSSSLYLLIVLAFVKAAHGRHCGTPNKQVWIFAKKAENPAIKDEPKVGFTTKMKH